MVSMDFFGSAPRPAPAPGSVTVGQLVRRARMALEGQFSGVWVKGEVSNFKRQASGHLYFTLKDDEAQLSCAVWRSNASQVSGPMADGVQVEAFGDLTVFEARGTMQMNVRRLRAAGQGGLQAAFEALKQKLGAEGLFDAARKKPMPTFPRVVALFTSPSGAALQDMLTILQRRAPWLRVLLFPCKVQGSGAAEEIAAGLDNLKKWAPELPQIDLLVVGRGGGSAEDLWCFNEEVLARAIASCGIPVISAVGHEVDFTIADFVADLRAPTPSAAAELLAPAGDELRARLQALEQAMRQRVGRSLELREREVDLLGHGALHRVPQRQLEQAVQRLEWAGDELARGLGRRVERAGSHLDSLRASLRAAKPELQIQRRGDRLSNLEAQMESLVRRSLATWRERLAAQERVFKSLGPEAVLARGYSLTTDSSGLPLKSVRQLQPGQAIRTQLRDGEVTSVVEKLE
jgi:exodeoxyribonuclease VII large subunit